MWRHLSNQLLVGTLFRLDGTVASSTSAGYGSV